MTWNGHTVILGRTGSGKSYYVTQTYVRERYLSNKAIMYWQGGHDNITLPVPYLSVNGRDDTKKILAVLDSKKHVVCYTPAIEQKIADQELKYWQQKFMSAERDLVIVVDEAQRYAPQGSIDTACHLLATGGRRWGISCVFICQRVAELSKTIATQCMNWIIFEHSSIDTEYLRQRGIEISDYEVDTLRKVKYKHLKKEL